MFKLAKDDTLSILPLGDISEILRNTMEAIRKANPTPAQPKAKVNLFGKKQSDEEEVGEETEETNQPKVNLFGKKEAPKETPKVNLFGKKETAEKVDDANDDDSIILGEANENLPDSVKGILDELNDEEDNGASDELKRIVTGGESEKLEREDWSKIEKWLADNFRNIPIYRVKNMIRQLGGNKMAWGLFKRRCYICL